MTSELLFSNIEWIIGGKSNAENEVFDKCIELFKLSLDVITRYFSDSKKIVIEEEKESVEYLKNKPHNKANNKVNQAALNLAALNLA